MERVTREESVVTAADFTGQVGEGNRSEVMGRYRIQEGNVKGQIVIDFTRQSTMAVVKTNKSGRKINTGSLYSTR